MYTSIEKMYVTYKPHHMSYSLKFAVLVTDDNFNSHLSVSFDISDTLLLHAKESMVYDYMASAIVVRLKKAIPDYNVSESNFAQIAHRLSNIVKPYATTDVKYLSPSGNPYAYNEYSMGSGNYQSTSSQLSIKSMGLPGAHCQQMFVCEKLGIVELINGECTAQRSLHGMVMHLNDRHKADRAVVADWLDSLHDNGIVDLSFKEVVK